MDAFVKLSPEDRRIFFEGAAAPLNLAPLMVEKDFWVCWTLKELFRLPAKSYQRWDSALLFRNSV